VWIAFGETPDTATLVGGAIVMLAVVIQISGDVRMPAGRTAEASPPPP
jgi:hypothetical protein